MRACAVTVRPTARLLELLPEGTHVISAHRSLANISHAATPNVKRGEELLPFPCLERHLAYPCASVSPHGKVGGRTSRYHAF